jgi:hypothetical protein
MPDETTPTREPFDPAKHIKSIKTRGGVMMPYLPAAARISWLRSEHPTAKIITEHITLTDQAAVFKCTITLDSGAVSTGHGSETKGDFGDYSEKAETKAISRALGNLGYGTSDVDYDEADVPAPPVGPAPRPLGGFPPAPGGGNQPSNRFSPAPPPSASIPTAAAPIPLAPPPPPVPVPLVTEVDDRAGRPRLWSEAGLTIDTFEYTSDPRPLAAETETAIRNLAGELGLSIFALVHGINGMEAAAHARGALARPGTYTRLGDLPEQLGIDIRDGFLLPLLDQATSLAAPEFALGQ